MCLHKLRKAMVRPSRDKLCGLIEVDEAYLGGKKHGKRGRGAEGENLVLTAAECDGKGIGRIGLSHIPDVSGITLCNTIGGMAKSGAMVITDGWTGYAGLEQVGYGHQTIRSDYSIGEDMCCQGTTVLQVSSNDGSWGRCKVPLALNTCLTI